MPAHDHTLPAPEPTCLTLLRLARRLLFQKILSVCQPQRLPPLSDPPGSRRAPSSDNTGMLLTTSPHRLATCRPLPMPHGKIGPRSTIIPLLPPSALLLSSNRPPDGAPLLTRARCRPGTSASNLPFQEVPTCCPRNKPGASPRPPVPLPPPPSPPLPLCFANAQRRLRRPRAFATLQRRRLSHRQLSSSDTVLGDNLLKRSPPPPTPQRSPKLFPRPTPTTSVSTSPPIVRSPPASPGSPQSLHSSPHRRAPCAPHPFSPPPAPPPRPRRFSSIGSIRRTTPSSPPTCP